jgi:L-arabinonolactonase
MKIDVVIDVKTTLGEGPLWDVEQQRLYWIDATGMRVFRATAQGSEVRAWDVPSRVGSIAIRKDGNSAICSLAKGFYNLDFRTGDCALVAEVEPSSPANWINDGKVDRAGRFFAGTMDSQETGPNGALYRLDPDMRVTQVDSGIVVSNGPCWSPDNKTFYFADSWSGEIWAYDYDIKTGTPSNRRGFARLDTSRGGAADGSTVDSEGYLWNAQVYDAKVIRYAPDGIVDRVIEMPVKKVTSVMFGGPNLDILYVTSMAKPPLPRFPGDGVLRGALFSISGLGVRGLPETRFGA